jgi:hypothetical protein
MTVPRYNKLPFTNKREASAKQTTTFPRFSELPVQLRDSIWEMIPEPQLVYSNPEIR